MKTLVVTGIISLLLISLMALGIGPVVAQDIEDEISKPLSFWESIDKYGLKVAKEIPIEEWPPIPEETHLNYPELYTNRVKQEYQPLTNYYWAGICTDYYNENWYGQSVVINGGSIDNDDPQNNYVRLTPHVVQKSNGDYLAVVLSATDDQDYLDLWTMRNYYEVQWQYEGSVPKNEDYEYSIYVDTNNSYYILYRSYPSGSWNAIRQGTMTGREMWVASFLEHAINSGSPGEHGTSAWKRFVLWQSDGTGDWWNGDAEDYAANYPLDYYTWLAGGYRYMGTWSEY